MCSTRSSERNAPTSDFRFIPEPPSIHAHGALDLLGNAFRGDYVGGMAEWLKNAVDAYIREGTDDDDQHIIVSLRLMGRRPTWRFECIDFVGSLFVEVDEDFKRWCDPDAASKGGKYDDVFGGHGNGGKFHMRENFNRAELVTYKNGGLTVFRFQEKDYGFDPKRRGQPCAPKKALEIAGIEPDALPDRIRERFATGDVRFTVVRGIGPTHMQRMRGGWKSFVERVQRHGQSKQLLDRAPIRVVVNGKVVIDDLDAPAIEPKLGFEDPRVVEMPGRLPFEGEELALTPSGGNAGTLVLNTSKHPFPRRGDNAVLNVIDVRGKRSIIATYRMHELGISNYQGASFIYGTLQAPRLEEMGLKTNERRRLPDNDYSAAVLHWVAEQVDSYAVELVEEVGREEQENEAAAMSFQNKLLNAWKNQLLRRFFVEVPAGAGEGIGLGGVGVGDSGGRSTEGDGADGNDGGGGDRGGEGTEGEQGGAGDERKRAQRFPLVLISGADPDPDTGLTIPLDPAQDVVYQRPIDVQRNVWWINAQRPLAQRIRQEYGINSPRWRDYLFQRYVDIISTYALHERWKDEADPNPDLVSQWLSETVGQVHDSAARDLESFLFAKEASSNGTVLADDAESEAETVAGAVD